MHITTRYIRAKVIEKAAAFPIDSLGFTRCTDITAKHTSITIFIYYSRKIDKKITDSAFYQNTECRVSPALVQSDVLMQ